VFNASNEQASARFFKVVEFDEQPPAISQMAPADGAFAIPRFSDISLKFSDVSGVDTNSISMTVSDLGTFTVADVQLTYTNGLLTFDNGGDTALGYYGTNVQVSLVMADVNGYVATNDWSFDLELEPDVATNTFVFGSPEAQRMGQRIGNIPTRVLAEHAAGGPIRMAAGADPWELHEVYTNGIIISYTGASAPPIQDGAFLANLTPATVDEIFYRQITGTYDDAANKLLILFTQDVRLTDIVEEGTASITEDSMVLEVSTNGTIVAARAVEKAWDFTVPLPRIGYSLDGKTFTYPNTGSSELEITTEECHFWLDPSLEVGLDIKWGNVERFVAIAHGDIETALICDVTAHAGASFDRKTLYDLPRALQPRTLVTLGAIGVPPVVVPVVAEIGLDLTLDADLNATTTMNFRYGFSKEIKTEFGVVYKDDNFGWRKTFTPEPTETEPFTYAVDGELGLGLTLRPVLYVVVLDVIGNGCAGIETGPAVRGGIRFETDGTEFAGYLEASVDWELGTRGWVFALFDPKPALPPWTIWEMEDKKLFPTDANLEITKDPKSVLEDHGASATFSCSASSGQPITYQWFHNGTIQYGKTSRTLTLSPLTYSHAGSYKVRATSGGETKTSGSASLTVVEPNSSVFAMKRIPGGTNSGTNPLGTGESYAEWYPASYSLTVSSFYMDRTEVTKAQWDTVYNWAVSHGYSFDNAGSGKASNHPVHTVNWYDCVKWCNARSQMEGKIPCYNLSTWSCDFNANGYRLPTSTEWEYAARGGLHGKRFPWGDTITHSRANYYSSSSYSYDTSSTRGYHPSYDDGGTPYTSPAGSFSSNGYGLYDMSGNVWEWCNTASGSYRDFRGGSWSYFAHYARCGYVLWSPPGHEYYLFGFRAVCR